MSTKPRLATVAPARIPHREKIPMRGLQKCNYPTASWGKLRNRFGAIPATLATESPGR
ncbi:hypothetical protein SS05631_c01380 [Sinorhizobium sp. CCBAU 05631]|uniref:Uncharacterized protein n=1 Tax=Rhizobium fredii TaxID=380 RepID=A0A2L0H0U2_RHIFR|nr:hypothetical protein SS05631_c01380 [Sinorhizobium sp. CCBAU 05631]AUX75093.1 hypothetical protein NXT3_CH00486 [Sinorhizobium fredii]